MKNLKERFVETSYLQPSVHSRGSQKSPEVTKVIWNVAPLPVTNITYQRTRWSQAGSSRNDEDSHFISPW
jgi:hypothetical protein